MKTESNFSGETPLQICEQYAAGHIDRKQLVDELTRFPYVKGGHTDGYDSLIADSPGAWTDVSAAVRRGLIHRNVYREVWFNRHPKHLI